MINALARELAIVEGYAVLTNPADPNDWDIDPVGHYEGAKERLRFDARRWLACYKLMRRPPV